MNTQKRKAFTLVELIVVITILSILGTIAFISLSGYSSDARDSIRLTDTKNIAKSLEVYSTKAGSYPVPGDEIQISLGATPLGYQGSMTPILLAQQLQISNGGIDPLTKDPYTYTTNAIRSKYELIAFMEGADYLSSITPSYAASYEGKTILRKGGGVGALFETDNTPVHFNTGSNIDIATLNTDYKLFYNQTDSVTGDSDTLITVYTTLQKMYDLDPSLIGYWDMDSQYENSGTIYLNDLSKNNNVGEVIGDVLFSGSNIQGNSSSFALDTDYIKVDLAVTGTGTLSWSDGYTINTFLSSHDESQISRRLVYLNGAYNLGIGSAGLLYSGGYAADNSGRFNVTDPQYKPLLNKWYNFGYTFHKDTNELINYVNGNYESTSTYSSIEDQYTPLTDALYIGRGSTSTNFVGSIDEVKIYNRTLIPSEMNFLNSIRYN